MIGKKVLDSKPASLNDVIEILSEIPEEEIEFEQSKTLDYAKKFVKIDKKKEKEKIEKLINEIPKINEEKAIKLVEILPKDEDSVRAIFSKEIYTLTEEEVKKILEILKE
jgi:DNA-directed RNA polymerase subunit F